MTRKTRKQRVLEALRNGDWMDGYSLCHPAIGGSEGLRRLRELRADGHRIEKRLKPDRPEGSTVYQYRLAPQGDLTFEQRLRAFGARDVS